MASSGATDWGSVFGNSGGGGGSSSGGGSGGTDWGSVFGSAKKSGGGGGFGLHSITGALGAAGSAVANVGEGIAGTALDIGKAVYVLPDELLSGKNEQQRMADYNKRLPFLSALGWGGEKGGSGLAQTFAEAGGKSYLPGFAKSPVGKSTVPISQAYGSNPVSALLNDVANVTMLAGPAAGAAGAAAGGGNEARLAAIAAGTETPGALGRTAGALQAVADAPGLPFRGAKSLLTGAAEKAIESGTTQPGLLARLGMKTTPAYQDFMGTVLEGKAQQRAVQDIIAKAPNNEAAVAALDKAGLHDAAGALDALRHTTPGEPPPILSGNYEKVVAERSAPPPITPPAGDLLGVPRFALAAEHPNLVPVPETVTGHEIATALHEAGFHTQANAFMGHGVADAVQPRIDAVRALGQSGFGKAADLLVAPQLAPTTGADVIKGLEAMGKPQLSAAANTAVESTAPKAVAARAVAEPPPVEVPANEAARAAVGAVKSATGARLGELPSIIADYRPGLVPLEDVTHGTLPAEGFVPPSLAKALSPRFTAPGDVAPTTQGLLSMLDPVNHAYYDAKMSLSPAPIVGRLGGHTSLVGLNAPHPLDSLLSALKVFTGKVSEKDANALDVAPKRLAKAAPLRATAAQMSEDVAGGGIPGKIASKLDTLAQKSPIMRWTAKMDDALRKGVYLAETHAGAGAQDALRTVNRVAGEFDALSPAEQAMCRRVVPFYNWHKQIALIGAHLAEDNPAKAVLLAHLGDTGEQVGHQSGGTPGELQIAGHAISPDFLVPFGEAGTTFKNLGAPMAGPVPKAVLGLTGWNPNTGKAFSGPVKGQDYRYAGIGQNLLKAAPQVGLLNSLLDAARGNDEVVRYNNGSPLLRKGEPIPTNLTPTDAALTFGGLRSENLKAAQERQVAVLGKARKQASGTSAKGSSGGSTNWAAVFGG